MAENIEQMSAKKGPHAERWRNRMIRGVLDIDARLDTTDENT